MAQQMAGARCTTSETIKNQCDSRVIRTRIYNCIIEDYLDSKFTE
jgi:hypothetical protein